MSLKPETSVMAGLAIMGVVYAIHSNFTPSNADIQGLPSGNKDVDSSERQATILSVGVVSGISLLAKDPTIFVMGSIATVAMALMTRHAVWTDSSAAPMAMSPGQSATSANDTATGPQMSATESYQMFQPSQFIGS